ncbi:heme peroxidase family protein [uncultured Friedmanniella sp.]|uniref:peroxidase family protein n=1 Tax=uncultured Friedmanniella sp. TaxID=335381 RepID=UPI0035CAE960
MRDHTGTGTCPFHQATSATAPSTPAAATEPTTGPGGVRRRTVLAAALGLVSAHAVGLRGTLRAAAATKRALKGSHGTMLRGCDIAAKYGRDREARFGLMFKKLPAYSPSDALLRSLAVKMNDGKAPLNDVKDSDVAFDTSIPAGYIYFGQFVDHDVTLDKTPLTTQKSDPTALVNYDTPRFDLGSVYGSGPTLSPDLYDAAKPGYLKVNPHDDLVDLPRDAVGAAYLGDPRNDENLIVAQLHTVFLRLHNKFRDSGLSFEDAQTRCRWHYQWLIVHDYLPKIVGQDVVDKLLVTKAGKLTAATTYYKPKNPAKPYMPIEFSAGAYRFGHSLIRAEYEVQDMHTVPIFGPDGYEDLRGSRAIPHNLWMDWNYFFDIPGMSAPDDRNMARRFDAQISLPLATLPSTVVAPTAGAIVALAERNLLRGKRLGLPAGQDVATAMGAKPLTNAQLGLTESGWKNKAPLWFYVLKEAELAGGHQLGSVGGRIVAEVILGLLALDKTSYFNTKPTFNPGADFGVGALILMADAFDARGRPVVDVPEEPDPQPDPDPVPDPADPVPDPVELEPIPVEPDEVINPEATDPLPGII